MLFNLLLTIFFVALNAFFVAAEFAIVKVRESQIELAIRTGNKLALIAKPLVHHLDTYLSATQLGITLASLGLGWIGESVVSQVILETLRYFGAQLTPEAAHAIALPVAFALITFLHIVFGELIPKSLAIQRSEKVTFMVAAPLRTFYYALSPAIWALNHFANWLLKLMGLPPAKEGEQAHSAEELRYLIEEGSRSGVIEENEHALLENVFDFRDTPVKQVMVPRNHIVGIERSLPTDEILEIYNEEGYTRLPVFDKTIDNIIGEVYGKDLLLLLMNRNLIILEDIIRPAFFVHENDKISDLMRIMQKRRIHMAIALDDFGGTAGIITMEDILEEIVGEIQDEYDEESPHVLEIVAGEFTVDAATSIVELNDSLPYPLEESEEYESLGGLITSLLGRIPEQGEIFRIDGYSCQIITRSERRIETVKLVPTDSESKDQD
ncbi:MAG: hemolysin family protein [Chloroflexota bacterium]